MSISNGQICSSDEPFGDAVNTSYNWWVSTKGDTMRICENRTPASAAAAGIKGQFCWDQDHWYVCVDTNTWKRIPYGLWT